MPRVFQLVVVRDHVLNIEQLRFRLRRILNPFSTDISQALHPPLLFRRKLDGSPQTLIHLLLEFRQLDLQRFHLIGLLRAQIARLVRVGHKVIELGTRSSNVLPFLRRDAAQGRPAGLEKRLVSLTINTARCKFLPVKKARQAASTDTRLQRQSQLIENCGAQIDERHRSSHSLPLRESSRQRDDQRDMHCRVIDHLPMPPFEMLIQSFAMISNDDHQRALFQLSSFQEAQQAANLHVHEPNLGIIGSILKTLAEEIGVIDIRNMGIVEMHPAQKRLRLLQLFQPFEGLVNNDVTIAIAMQGLVGRRGPGEVVIVGMKAAVQAELGIEHKGRDECARLITAGSQQGSECRNTGIERFFSVGAQPVLRRIQPRKH